MSHANKADKLLIKPAAGARPASPRTRGRIIRKARKRGQSPDESHAAQRQPGWQWPQTDQPAESYRPPSRAAPPATETARLPSHAAVQPRLPLLARADRAAPSQYGERSMVKATA